MCNDQTRGFPASLPFVSLRPPSGTFFGGCVRPPAVVPPRQLLLLEGSTSESVKQHLLQHYHPPSDRAVASHRHITLLARSIIVVCDVADWSRGPPLDHCLPDVVAAAVAVPVRYHYPGVGSTPASPARPQPSSHHKLFPPPTLSSPFHQCVFFIPFGKQVQDFYSSKVSIFSSDSSLFPTLSYIFLFVFPLRPCCSPTHQRDTDD